MNEELDLLVTRWLAAEASPEDEARLADLLRDSEEARLRFAELADQEAALRILSQSSVNAQEIREQYEAPPKPTRRATWRRLARGGANPDLGPRTAIFITMAAAALLLLLTVLYTPEGKSTPTPRPSASVTTAPVPQPTPAPQEQVRPPVPENPQPPSLPPPAPEVKREPRPEPEKIPPPPVPEKSPAPAPEPLRETKPAPTILSVARLVNVRGKVHVTTGEARSEGRVGLDLLPGQGIEVSNGTALLEYRDKTRLELADHTQIRDLYEAESPGPAAKGKRLFVVRGAVSAEVAKQPETQPMVLSSQQSNATVVGTTLRLVVGADSTRLDVKEGRVMLTSTLTGKAVEVQTGQYAVATAGVELAARAQPIDEIFILASEGKIRSELWRRQKDDQSIQGMVMECPLAVSAAQCEARGPKGLGYVEYPITVDANKDYTVWVRGRCMAASQNPRERFASDMIALEIPGAVEASRVLPRCFNGFAYGFTGWGYRLDTLWISGDSDPAFNAAGEQAVVPIVVRFPKGGAQVLRMYIYEGPMRVDAIWLSATQKTRPESSHKGPEQLRK